MANKDSNFQTTYLLFIYLFNNCRSSDLNLQTHQYRSSGEETKKTQKPQVLPKLERDLKQSPCLVVSKLKLEMIRNCTVEDQDTKF